MTTRTELLALGPDRYLAHGYRDATGRAWPELTSLWAAAAAEQLRAKGVTATALERLVATAAREAQHTREPLEPALAATPAPAEAREWVRRCAAAVKSVDDREPFARHLGATLRVLALAEASTPANRALQPTQPGPSQR